MSDFGTLSWLGRTGGRMTLRDRLLATAQGVKARAMRRKTSLKSERRAEDILPPDSAIALEALALCRESSPVFLLNHCLRSYFWARLLDETPDKTDPEGLFVAMMLHDLGLTPAHKQDPLRDRCFAATGAREAHRMALRHGWSDERATTTADAIALHLNVTIDHHHGPEARLVRLGSGLDVAGLGMSRLPREQVETVVARYPRAGFKEGIQPLLSCEAQHHPHCRMGFLWRQFDFGRMIHQAPFAE